MGDPDFDRARKQASVYLRLGVASLFLLALLFPLGRFFILSSLALVVIFFGMSLYYRRWSIRSDTGYGGLHNELRTIPNVRPPENRIDLRKYRTVFLALGFILFSFILVIVAVVTGNNSSASPAEEWMGTGTWHYNNSSFDSALVYFDKVIEIDPKHAVAHYYKGLCLYEQNNYNDAVIPLTQAIEIDPEYSQAMLLLGDCYYNVQNYDPALQWYSSAYELGERSANLSHLLGFLYDNKGQSDSAITFYLETLSMDSTRAEIYERLAVLDPSKAAEYSRLGEQWKAK